MQTTLAYSLPLDSLFQQPLESSIWPSYLSYTTPNLSGHLTASHTGPSKTPSSSISTQILNYQLTAGLTSNRITGVKWMADVNPTALFTVNNLTTPTSGAAWLYYYRPGFSSNYTVGFLTYYTNVPLGDDIPDPGVRVAVSTGSTINFNYYITQGYSFKPTDFVRYIKPTFFNLVDTGYSQYTNFTGLTKSGDTWSGNPVKLPGFQLNANVQAANSTYKQEVPLLSANMFDSTDPKLFKEADVYNDPTVVEAIAHLSTPHTGIDEETVSTTKGFSSFYLRQSKDQYNLKQQWGGDAWLSQDNKAVYPTTASTGVNYWIAYYNGGVAGKKVTNPANGQVVARAVNGQTMIRCGFEMPNGVTPVADSGVVLRRLNPTWGYRVYTAYKP